MLFRATAWTALVGSAAVAGGVYLYAVRGPRRNRGPLGLATGLLIGQQIGAIAGWTLAGPAGLLPGSVSGGIAGAVLGHDLGTTSEDAAT